MGLGVVPGKKGEAAQGSGYLLTGRERAQHFCDQQGLIDSMPSWIHASLPQASSVRWDEIGTSKNPQELWVFEAW